MATELELISASGNFNFAEPGNEFLDVEEGRGMEPGDPKFTEKVWARSLLKTGATLALEALHEKELVFPLKLRGATKDQLTASIQKINRIITTSGCQVKWQDEGASKPTYFDLISGQLDDEYDFRLGQNNWLKCRLRLFVQPLGYSSRNGARALMVAGSATTVVSGTGVVVTFHASGPLAGDAPALMQAQIFQRSSTGRYGAVSVLPSPEYIPYLAAASYVNFHEQFKSDPKAPGATYMHRIATVGGFGTFEFGANNSGPYVGETRLLAVARTPSGATPFPIRRLYGGTGFSGYMATPVATAVWGLLDLGVITTASSLVAAGNGYGFELELNSVSASAGASAVIDIAGVVQLPEISTCWLNTPLEKFATTSFVTFDGVSNEVRENGYIGVPASGIPASGPGVQSVGLYARGAIPQITPSATGPMFAVLAAEQGGNMNTQITAAFNVLERTRYVF